MKPAAIAWATALLAGAFAAGGCGDDASTSTFPPPGPPSATGATSAGTTTGAESDSTGSDTGVVAPCGTPVGAGENPCPDDQVCAAPFATGDTTPPSDDAYACQDACIPAGATAQWCFNDTSCCEGTCRKDGLCGVGPIGDSGDETGGSSSSGGDSSGSDSSGSSSGGSSSGTR